MGRVSPKIFVYQNYAYFGTGQCDCDCDCACAETGPALGHIPFQETSRWQKASSLVNLPVGPTHSAIFNPDIPVSIAYCNQSARQILDAMEKDCSLSDLTCRFPDIPQAQIKHSLEMLASLNLVTSGNKTSVPVTPRQAAVLTAWLHLTDRCNLRCDYCYLPHRREDMSIETGKAAIDAVFRSARKYDYERIKLKYAGGETLLRSRELLELHAYASLLSEQQNIALDGVVLTNGTLLTPALAAELKAHGLRLMISLDGLGNLHDTQRHYAAGRSSFADVQQGIHAALEAGIKPDISITISSRNAHGLAELLEWILDLDLPFSINFYRENDLSVSQATLALDDEKIVTGMRSAFKVIEKHLPHRSLLASVLDRTNLSAPHIKTCSVGSDYLVFDQNGRVAQCQMLMNRPVGNVQNEDPLSLVRKQTAGIQNLSVLNKQGCDQCQWRHWCTGGCPLTTYRSSGSYDQKSPNCHIYQALFPDVVRLEGLRLLKYRQ